MRGQPQNLDAHCNQCSKEVVVIPGQGCIQYAMEGGKRRIIDLMALTVTVRPVKTSSIILVRRN